MASKSPEETGRKLRVRGRKVATQHGVYDHLENEPAFFMSRCAIRSATKISRTQIPDCPGLEESIVVRTNGLRRRLSESRKAIPFRGKVGKPR